MSMVFKSGSRGGGGGVRPSDTATPVIAAITSTSTIATRWKRRGCFSNFGIVAWRCSQPIMMSTTTPTVLVRINVP